MSRDARKGTQGLKLSISQQMRPYFIVMAVWEWSYTYFIGIQVLEQFSPEYPESF